MNMMQNLDNIGQEYNTRNTNQDEMNLGLGERGMMPVAQFIQEELDQQNVVLDMTPLSTRVISKKINN